LILATAPLPSQLGPSTADNNSSHYPPVPPRLR